MLQLDPELVIFYVVGVDLIPFFFCVFHISETVAVTSNARTSQLKSWRSPCDFSPRSSVREWLKLVAVIAACFGFRQGHDRFVYSRRKRRLKMSRVEMSGDCDGRQKR